MRFSDQDSDQDLSILRCCCELFIFSSTSPELIYHGILFRIARGTVRSSYSPRKERALKIYTDESPTASGSKAAPDLD